MEAETQVNFDNDMPLARLRPENVNDENVNYIYYQVISLATILIMTIVLHHLFSLVMSLLMITRMRLWDRFRIVRSKSLWKYQSKVTCR